MRDPKPDLNYQLQLKKYNANLAWRLRASFLKKMHKDMRAKEMQQSLSQSTLVVWTPPVIAAVTVFFVIVVGWCAYFFISKDMREARLRVKLEKEAKIQSELEVQRQMQANQAAQYERELAIQRAQRERELENQRQIKLEAAKNLETSGRYEEAARCYDYLAMYEKAGECRRLDKTTYQISTAFSMGKDGAISVNCPNCGSSQAVESKQNLVICKHCGHSYIIPKKVLDMM